MEFIFMFDNGQLALGKRAASISHSVNFAFMKVLELEFIFEFVKM